MITRWVKSRSGIPKGTFAQEGRIFLYQYFKTSHNLSLEIDASKDGIDFEKYGHSLQIVNEKRKPIKLYDLVNLRISKDRNKYFLTYKLKSRGQQHLQIAKGADLSGFTQIGKVDGISQAGVVVSDYKYKNSYVLYFGEGSIGVAYSVDLVHWQVFGQSLLEAQKDFFGLSPLSAGNATLTKQGILLFYYVNKSKKGFNHFLLKAALFDRDDPRRLIHNFAQPIFESPDSWSGSKIEPVGIVKIEDRFISYWRVGKKDIFAIFHPFFIFAAKRPNIATIIIRKLAQNPIIAPIVNNFWESKATFNPAAIYEQNKVHIVYRAIGDDDVSVLGYAASSDGVSIDERLDKPIYMPTEPFELSSVLGQGVRFSPYASPAGSFGGVEDPRIVKLDDKFYMTYVAYNGINPPRVALTSIDAADFVDKNWNWQRPVLISKPGVVDKNACILSQKVNGQYVIFHRIFPDILIDFVNDLDFDGTRFLEGQFKIEPRKYFWDSRKIGVGAPPVRTDDGWLLIYQAVGDVDLGRYKVGAMLLSLSDPTRVLARTMEPIMEPDQWYENEGFKSGVVYPCGAVTLGRRLLIYYGGADSYVCAAWADLESFVGKLKTHKQARLLPISTLH